MQRAIDLVLKNAPANEIPVGAIIVKDGEIIASAVNRKEALKDVSGHAEILAIREASQKLNRWRLDDCEIYVTLEPCPMCAWAILRSRIKSLTFGAYDTVYGAFSTLPRLQEMSNSTLKVRGGIMESECKQVIEEYFKDLR